MTLKAMTTSLALAAVLSGCATEGAIDASTGQPMTEVQRAQQNCRAAVIGTALLGALAGAAADRRNRGSGVLIGGAAGAAVGGAFCAVMLSVANEHDRQRIAELQRAALETGQAQNASYKGDDGAVRQIKVNVQDAADPAAASGSAPRTCRYSSPDIAVAGKGSATLKRALYCRSPDGNWSQIAEQTARANTAVT